MSTSSKSASSPARNIYPIWGVLFILLGLIVLGYNVGFLSIEWLNRLAAFWPVALIGLGLYLIGSGRTLLAFAPRPFALERGAYEQATLTIHAGIADINLLAFAGSSQLAVGQFPAGAGPKFIADGIRAKITLDHREAALFAAGAWTLSLAKNLPWTLQVQSDLGNSFLNLRDLTVAQAAFTAHLGDIDLTLPAMGVSDMTARLTLGDLTVRVPEGMALKLRFQPGGLAELAPLPAHFIQTSPTEWLTPNFEDAPHRTTLKVELTTGVLQVTD